MQYFRSRQINHYYPIIYLDATFINTRAGSVSKEAYYIALAVKPDATREVIGIYNAPTEAASIWHDIIGDLKQRGLQQCDLFVTDNGSGMDGAIEQQFSSSCIQKCVLHLKRNVLHRIKKTHRVGIAEDLKEVFQIENPSDTFEAAIDRSKSFYNKWKNSYSHLKIFNDEHQIHYYFNYLKFHPDIRNMIYTTNWIERLNKDFKRTIKMRNSMPSVESVLTLLSKVAIDKNNDRYCYLIVRLKADSMFE